MGPLIILLGEILCGCIISSVYILSKARKNEETIKDTSNGSYSARIFMFILMSMTSLPYGIIMVVALTGRTSITWNNLLVYAFIGLLNLAASLVKGIIAGNSICSLVDQSADSVFSRVLIKMSGAEILAIAGLVLFFVIS